MKNNTQNKALFMLIPHKGTPKLKDKNTIAKQIVNVEQSSELPGDEFRAWVDRNQETLGDAKVIDMLMLRCRLLRQLEALKIRESAAAELMKRHN
ncbi:MAG: hypothetical protein P8Y42_13175 [Exilibacterium sp.]